MGSGTWVAVVSGAVAGFGGACLGLLLMGRVPTPANKPLAAEPLVNKTKPNDVMSQLPVRSAAPASVACAASTAESGGNGRPMAREALAPPTEADRVRDAQALREAQQNRIIAHEQEPRDPRWAGDTETKLNASFSVLTQMTASSLEKLECRSVSCLASFSWPNEETARRKMYELVTRIGPDAPSASRFMNLEASDGKGPVRATMILDFTEGTDAENVPRK